jgi:putative ABC transport system permease protein
MIGLRHPLWRKAPTRLLRHPALLAAVALGAMLVAVVSTAFPLFLSASDSNLLASAIDQPSFTPYGAGLEYRSTHVPFDVKASDGGSLMQERQHAFAQLVAASPNFGPAAQSMAAPALGVSVAGAGPSSASVSGRLFAGTDVLTHVQIASGKDGSGVWLPDRLAATLHAHPGDTIELNSGKGVVDVTLDGTYVALSNQTPDGYWQIWQDEIQASCKQCPPSPGFILADPAQLIDLQTRLHRPSVDEAFVAPARVSPPLTLDELRALRTTIGGIQEQMQGRVSPLGLLFPCCGPASSLSVQSSTELISQTANVVDIVEGRSVGLRGPAVVLLLAGLAIAFVVVSAAGVFSFSSRPVESAFLSVRGWGPLRVAAKAALESTLPVVVGALAGFGIADVMVRAVGPNGPIESSARTTAMAGVAAAAVGAIAVVGAAGAVMFAAHHEHKDRLGRALRWVPWELVAFGALIWLGRSLHAGGGLVGAGEVERPGAPVFLYPIAFASAVGILVARVAAVAIVWRARARGGAGVSARWLTVRRLASSVRLAAIFLIAAAIAVSVSVSAQGLVSSLRTTVTAKAKIFVGSDVQAQMVPGAIAPTDFPYPLTEVERAPDSGHFDDVPTSKFELLVIDTSTFAGAAFWIDHLADVPLAQLIAPLDAVGSGSLPIVIANGSAFTPSSITVGVEQVPVDVVGRAVSFPGASSLSPVVVVSRDAALRAFPTGFNLLTMGGSTTEFWMRGPTAAVVAAIARADLGAYSVLTADQVRDIPFVVAAVNTFLTLDVLGIMALLLIVVLAVGYLHVRQRPRVVATGLSSRMGVSSSLLRRALILELGGVVLGAIAIGVPTGLIASAVVLRSLDPLALIPPHPFFVAPWIGVIAASVGLMAAAVIGGWLVDRVTRGADLGEVMRVAG